MYLKSSDPWLNFILTLIEETKGGGLIWNVLTPIQVLYTPNEWVRIMFKTFFDNNNILLFEKGYEEKIPTSNNLSIQTAILAAQSALYPTNKSDQYEIIKKQKIVLMITDKSEQAGWEVPFYEATKELYDIVRYNATGAMEIYNKYSKQFP